MNQRRIFLSNLVLINLLKLLPNEDNMHVLKKYAHINPLLQSESNDESAMRLLNEEIGTTKNLFSFPAQVDCLSNHAYPSIQSLVFPSSAHGTSNASFYD